MKAKAIVEINSVAKNKKNSKFIVSTNIGEYKFSEDTIVNNLVLKGKKFTAEEFEKIVQSEKTNDMFNKVLNYISYQMRSEYEIKKYLNDREATDSEIESILEKVKTFGYVNDYELAKSIFDSFVRNKKGPLALERKLTEKKIPRNIILEMMKNYTIDMEIDIARELAQKLVEKVSQEPVKKQKQKVYNRMAYAGFTNEAINCVVSALSFNDNSSEKLELEISKLKHKYRNEEEYTRNNKILASLLRKGFEYSDILNKMNE